MSDLSGSTRIVTGYAWRHITMYAIERLSKACASLSSSRSNIQRAGQAQLDR
jgi:hypothetical protein